MRGSPATRERGYMPQLDALRFFAVMGVLLVHNWQPSPFVNFVVTSLVTFVVAAVSWRAFERPVNGLKRHFRYTKPDLVPADAAAAST
jgi:peptidoglycan/LPS O-acetylase OafA/YrhL